MESPFRKGVDGRSWQPGQSQFCQDLESEDTVFNTWRGLKPMAAPGNWQKRVKPFLRHVTFLIPEKAERKRHLQWLAHVVQYPEVLPHTSYLMIATTPGIGRNLYASIIVRALRGHAAAGVSLPDLLDGSFTGRLSKKLLAIVDEAREGSGDRRHQRTRD
jgi:primase-polymerase (primpol)-like protein